MSEATLMAGQSSESQKDSRWERWLAHTDEAAERFGDWVNPILVKETRQALKSRQFVFTFSVILVASLAWTIIGCLSMMPQIYTSPSAARMLIGYYVVLAIPMLLIVPLTAYHSLEAEIEDGTLELLSITALSPWQIVLGKLASASLQMLLYLVTLFPCVAFAYTLRGVDLPTIALIMATLITFGLTLTVIAIAFAPLARGRTGRISTLLVVIGVLLVSEYLVGAMIVSMIVYGNPMPISWTVFLLVFSVVFAISLSHLLLTATAAQLTPESENRSSGIRWSLLSMTAVLAGFVAFAIEWQQEELTLAMSVFSVATVFLAVLWTAAGAMMAGESSAMTPRIQRELPGNFISRMLLTFFTPGPATGLVFASIAATVVAAMVVMGLERMSQLEPMLNLAGKSNAQTFVIVYTSYLIVLLNGVRWIIALVRVNNHPRVEIGLAALISVAVLSALVPYSIGLHLNDYRPYAYSGWQFTNWVWTLGLVLEGNLGLTPTIGLQVVALGALLLSVATLGRRALPLRTATPEDVRRENDAIAV